MDKRPWTLTQLQRAYHNDLTMCHTRLETTSLEAITRREIIETAKWIKATRKFTPGEIAILEKWDLTI